METVSYLKKRKNVNDLKKICKEESVCFLDVSFFGEENGITVRVM